VYAAYPDAEVFETETAVFIEPVEVRLDSPDNYRLEDVEEREVVVRLPAPLGNRVLVWRGAQLGAATPGRGVGSALLEHRLAGITGPAYLESSNQRNVSLYGRFGFEVIQGIPLPDGGPTLWTMLRR
jgi:hypothetical protein